MLGFAWFVLVCCAGIFFICWRTEKSQYVYWKASWRRLSERCDEKEQRLGELAAEHVALQDRLDEALAREQDEIKEASHARRKAHDAQRLLEPTKNKLAALERARLLVLQSLGDAAKELDPEVTFVTSLRTGHQAPLKEQLKDAFKEIGLSLNDGME